MPDENVSALPSAARQKLVQLQGMDTPPAPTPPPADEPPAPTPPTPPVDTPPVDTPPPSDKQGERVTMSREELNDLQAAAGLARGMQARLEESEVRNEALLRRLTELEESHKGTPKSPAPAPSSPPVAPAVELTEATFTEEENEQFGDSREYVEKVATNAAIKVLRPLLDKLEANFSELRTRTQNTTQTLEQQQKAQFNKELLTAVPNLRELISNKHWVSFLSEVDDLSGYPIERILATHLGNMNAEGAAKVYKRFEAKYIKPLPAQSSAEYAGALPGASAANPPADPGAPKPKLKLSDRSKASKDYIAGRITYEQLQEVNNKFTEAEKAGNVDFNS